ncbi:hypothetical protein N7481_007210 [Penicillium waksmanii]|uniref:uncharacterized protein n=1 Tax=Penicillium waksmanii TaxID=69791 RepID=UPI0025491D2F|nr:uncharacterized protein N7481_007210 [Penicillium waksmanii]KAJ5979912.1 hypothetical protein N7481_007210 [Penicillium waksmanii]
MLHTSRYIGPLSCLAPALSIVRNTEATASQAPTPPNVQFQGDLTPNQETFEYLVAKYLSDIQSIYPLLDETLPFLSPEWLVENNETDLTHMQRFMLEMVYSIASHRVLDELPNHEGMDYYQKLADASHRRGLMIFDKAATDISMHTLETVTLAALHSLLSPQAGNIGQLVGLAARLAIDLGAVDKPGYNSNEGNESEQIYKSIYCLENQYATALDRPGLLPQPVIDPESSTPQDVLCAVYRIQACFRSQRGNVDATSLLQELDGYVSTIEQMPIRSIPNIIATVYETRLLIRSDDEESAMCLLEIYSQKFYIRTALSPSWAYRAGLVIVSKISTYQLHPGAIQTHNLHKSYQAYGNCLLFLEQCSRRWPSANALRMSLQDAASRT